MQALGIEIVSDVRDEAIKLDPDEAVKGAIPQMLSRPC